MKRKRSNMDKVMDGFWAGLVFGGMVDVCCNTFGMFAVGAIVGIVDAIINFE